MMQVRRRYSQLGNDITGDFLSLQCKGEIYGNPNLDHLTEDQIREVAKCVSIKIENDRKLRDQKSSTSTEPYMPNEAQLVEPKKSSYQSTSTSTQVPMDILTNNDWANNPFLQRRTVSDDELAAAEKRQREAVFNERAHLTPRTYLKAGDVVDNDMDYSITNTEMKLDEGMRLPDLPIFASPPKKASIMPWVIGAVVLIVLFSGKK